MAKKEIKNVVLSHLDLNTTAKSVSDGTLQVAHNVRRGTNGLEAVYGFAIEKQITEDSGYRVVYKHLDNYLAIYSDGSLHNVLVDDDGVLSSQQNLIANIDSGDLRIYHCGNTLFLTLPDNQYSFIYSSDSYKAFYTAELPPIDKPIISYKYKTIQQLYGSTLIYGCSDRSDGTFDDTNINRTYLTALEDFKSEGYIFGSFYIIIAYKLFDGTIIKNSSAMMIESENGEQSSRGHFFYRYKSNYEGCSCDHAYYSNLTACKPTISGEVSASIIGSGLVESVAIYATQVNDTYDFENIHSRYLELDKELEAGAASFLGSVIFSDDISEMIDKPFYEVAEVALKDLDSNSFSVELNFNDHFEDIVHNKLYTPSFSTHSTIYRNMIEYNGRLHTFGQDVKLYEGVVTKRSDDELVETIETYTLADMSEGYRVQASFFLLVGGRYIEVYSTLYDKCYMKGDIAYLPLDNFISYPDIRATKVELWANNGTHKKLVKSIPLVSCASHNIAYCQKMDGDKFSGYTMIKLPLLSEIGTDIPYVSQINSSYSSTNEVAVSQLGNPFVFDTANYYAIEGSDCEIYAMTTAADQLTENSFGKHPLILFTNYGIYALEQGDGDLLYSSVATISTTPQMKDISTVTLEGLIFYTSNDGVMVLAGRTSKLLSGSIEPNLNSVVQDSSFVSLDNYLKGCRLYPLFAYNEILLYNNRYSYGYLFSIENEGWSSRDVDITPISKTLYLENGTNIVSTLLEEDKSRLLMPRVVTNPLKLGSYALKKIEYLELHHDISPTSFTKINLWASNDLVNWVVVGSSIFGRKIGRTASSWRFYKVEISLTSSAEEPFFCYMWMVEFKLRSRYLYAVQ